MNKKLPKDYDLVWFLKERENFKVNARGLSEYKIFKYFINDSYFSV